MDFGELSSGLQQVWESKPVALVLLALGVVIFLFLVVDCWYHKRRRKRRVHPHSH